MTYQHSPRNPRRRRALLAGMALGLLAACSDTTVPDLNNPSQASYEVITDRGQLQALATGLINGDRAAYGTEVTFFETMGRDLFRIDGSESRWITSLLGTSINSSDFIGSGIFNGPYATIRGGALLRKAVTASTGASPALSDQEKAATRGYAQTIEALSYLRIFETRGTRGAAINVNPDSIVPIRCKAPVLAYISLMLDSAQTDLRAAGNIALPFSLPSGFAGFGTADAPNGTDFRAFNRALKAKVEAYRGFSPLEAAAATTGSATPPDAVALTAALGAIDSSFYVGDSTRAGLDVGVYHTYSTAAGETSNPLVDVSVFRANPKVISEGAEVGDLRVQAKVDTSSSNVNKAGSGVSSKYYLRAPGSPTDRLALLKNGELVLLRAEILWGLNRDAEALVLVNRVRRAAGLGPLVIVDHQQLIRAILKEKRYELLFESPNRLLDYRSLGIINELGTERGNNPLATLPIPNNESVARSGAIACVP